VVIDGKVLDIVGDATFIHAIQGMRPDSVSLLHNICGRKADESSLPGGTLDSSLPEVAKKRASWVAYELFKWSSKLLYVLAPALFVRYDSCTGRIRPSRC
jgi:hypothetical protein